MATVTLPIGGKLYDLTCRDGGEPALRELAVVVDEKVRRATASAGQTDEVRRLLYASLLLAEELAEIRRRAPDQPASPAFDPDAVAGALERLAERVERLAHDLETDAQAA